MNSAASGYLNRLALWRGLWAVFCIAFTLFVSMREGIQMDFLIFMAVLWFIGHPRNAAKRLAKRARRQAELLAATQDEINRRE